MTGNSMELLTRAEQMLAQAATTADVQDIIDYAEAARVYAREAKLGTAAINHATVIKLRAERMLAEMVDAGQASGAIATNHDGRRSSDSEDLKPTLKDLGISAPRLNEARTLARFSETELAKRVERATAADREVSRSKLLQEARDLASEAERARRAAAAAEVDAREPEQPAQVSVEPGQWWQLGSHKLYCGNSTDLDFIAHAAGAQFAFADPPYNAGKADWDQGFVWAHDYLADSADVVAVTPGISAIASFFATTKMPYRWSMAAWITNGMTRGALGFGNWIYVALFASHGGLHRNAQDHLRITVNAATTDETAHASRKPAALMVDLIELFTKPDGLVVDPFLGSGTTLFAAEQTGRRCVGAEIDPTHCAEIIARYGSDARLM